MGQGTQCPLYVPVMMLEDADKLIPPKGGLSLMEKDPLIHLSPFVRNLW